MKLLLALLLTATFATSQAQTSIKIEEVTNHMGDTVKLKAKIFGIKTLSNAKGTPTLINLGAAYPNQLLTIVIWQEVKEKLGFDPSDAKYIGGLAEVTGKIESYKGKPQITLTNPSQLHIFYDEEVKLSDLPKVDKKQ